MTYMNIPCQVDWLNITVQCCHPVHTYFEYLCNERYQISVIRPLRKKFNE